MERNIRAGQGNVMTSKESLFQLLKKQKQIDQEQKGQDLQARLPEWRSAIDRLIRRLFDWLQDAVEEKLLAVQQMEVKVIEERLGEYTAPGLKIVAPSGATVRIAPKARFVVGAFGRVDLECAPRKAILVRNELPERWEFAELAPRQGGWVFRDLDEDSFWKTLGDLISGQGRLS